jgi:LysM repeat protein
MKTHQLKEMRSYLKIATLVMFLLIGSSTVYGQAKVFRDYSEKYKDIAVSEMYRTGIPASIKLAQGLLESNAGRSELATRANNHFGIKCGGDWTGKTFMKEDDDYANGQLIKSCFRVFSSVEESYVAHSEFLRNPAKVNRYGFLFDLSSTDYKGWAHGLKQAGYATAPTYAQRLIKIIEDYQLYQYDKEVVVPKNLPVIADIGANKKGKHHSKVHYPDKPTTINQSKMAYARDGETVSSLANRHKTTPNRLIRYNELITDKNQRLTAGEIVYLEPKMKNYSGDEEIHIVQNGETLYNISQKYGIQMKPLAKRNRIKVDELLVPGSHLLLKGSLKRGQKPSIPTPDIEFIPFEEPSVELSPSMVSQPSSIPLESIPTPSYQYHEVAPGDTLYNISRRYNVAVDSIKSQNNLQDNHIQIGQVLQIP